MTCRTGCATRDHRSYGECLRAASLQVGWSRSATDVTLDRSFEKRKLRELDLYKQARDAGIQPDGTSTGKIRFAMDQSDKAGMAYGTDFQVIPRADRRGYDQVSRQQVAEVTASLEATDHEVLREAAHEIKGNAA